MSRTSQRQRRPNLTDAQTRLLEALDDAAEHAHWEFDPDEYRGVSTVGFARIKGISGNGSFYRSLQSMAETDNPLVRERDRRDGYLIDVGGSLKLSVTSRYTGGYSMSITNVRDFIEGPEYQRLDVRERLHRLVLQRLQSDWGYLDDAYVVSRLD